MAEQEKKQEQISYKERLARAIQSMKGKPLPTDTEMFKGDMPKGILDKLRKN